MEPDTIKTKNGLEEVSLTLNNDNMPHLSEIKKKVLTDGIIGKYVHGSNMTVGWVTIEKGSKLGLHQHPHEQITILLEGKMEMQIGDEFVLLEPGMIQVIPSDRKSTRLNSSHSSVSRMPSSA